MITGYNTDVKHRDTVFHVQTEDKGLSNPHIESLIYVGGRVLGAKRASYAALIEQGKGDRAISAMMEQQHRMMIAAIRSGRFDEKMNLGTGEPQREPTAKISLLDKTKDDKGPSLDQVILEYLTSEAEQEQLLLELGDDTPVEAGRATDLVLSARSSRSGDPLPGVQVSVKMISTFSRPQLLGEGATDDQGAVRIPIEVPEVARGSAALIVSGVSRIGRAEIKQLL